MPRRLLRKAVQQGRNERRGSPYSVPYGEPLSDARTPLASFVNSLLAKEFMMPITMVPASLPVVVDESKCIARKGCSVCVEVCPLDVLAIDVTKGSAYMKYDECWYCLPCETDCPTGAVSVHIPYLVR